MGTWAGAFVNWKGRGDLVEILDGHHIDMVTVEPKKGWLYVRTAASFDSLRVPRFAQALSEELGTQVIGFFLQSTASVEEVVCFDRGERVRSLRYNHDEGGWLERDGKTQDWEHVYFFGRDESVEEEDEWPLNLPDELADEELERYRRARAEGDPEPVLDLFVMGNAWGLERLARHLGVDPNVPGARHEPVENRRYFRKVLLAGLVVALFWAFMFYLGARGR